MTTDLQERDAGTPLDERIAWLAGVCSRDEGRVAIERPWLATFSDGPWTVATDGHRLVALRGDYGYGPRPDAPNIRPILDAIAGATPHSIDLVALRHFVGVDAPDVAIPDCPKCKNRGEVACETCAGDGAIETECSKCGQDCDEDCDDCDGAGTVDCDCEHVTGTYPQEVARLFGDTFNRRLLAYPLRHLPGDSATWQQISAQKAAMIDGGDWRIYIMPVRDNGCEPARSFPA